MQMSREKLGHVGAAQHNTVRGRRARWVPTRTWWLREALEDGKLGAADARQQRAVR